MLDIAEKTADGEYRRLDLIAQSQGISEKYLESIVNLLMKAGLLEGQRGRGGGYRLTRKPEEYTAGEILRVTEGSLAPVACLECEENACARADTCRTLPLWEKLDDLICGYLDSVHLSDLCKFEN